MKEEVKISQLQIELKHKLLNLKSTKQLKNNEIANITGRSESTISEILSDKRAFADTLIYSVMSKLGDYFQDGDLVTSLRQYTKIWNIAQACKKASDMRMVIGNTGIGKSVVFKRFASKTEHVYYLKVDRKITWNKMLLEINRVMGIEVWKKTTAALLENVIRKVEMTSGNNPTLIIDESEVLGNAIFKEIKNLYTSTEGLLGILVVGITEVKKRIARLAGLDSDSWRPTRDDSNIYTTFARRIKVFRIDNISYEDITEFCRIKGISDEKVIAEACKKWWNYGEADTAIQRAKQFGIDLQSITLEEFEIL
jgi:type II secretory pathway predicted ATPase ExeA